VTGRGVGAADADGSPDPAAADETADADGAVVAAGVEQAPNSNTMMDNRTAMRPRSRCMRILL
jgi:hypothetical protein